MLSKMIFATCTVGVQMAVAENLFNTFFDEENKFAHLEQESDIDLPLEGFRRELKKQPSKKGYFRSDSYLAKDRDVKLWELWNQIVPDDTTNAAPPMEPYWKEFSQLLSQKANGSFCNNGDEMRKERIKTTHTQGVVAKVRWDVIQDNGMGYTGIYENGSDTAILRFSQTTNLIDSSPGLFPSVAIKFLIDGHRSMNLFGMPNFTGTNSWDFFSQPFKSRVEPFKVYENPIEIETILRKLIEGSRRPFATGVCEPAEWNNYEWLEKEKISCPYELHYVSDIHFDDEKEFDVDGNFVMFYDQLKRIESGETILKVFAKKAQLHPDHDGLVHIANIVLESQLFTGVEGDKRLQFRHQQVSKDYKYWPQNVKWHFKDKRFERTEEPGVWLFDTPESEWPQHSDEDAKAMYTDQIEQFGCPFGWLLSM